MKERPILFSTPMIQAILDGRKTMTRRTKGLKFSESFKWNFIRHLHKACGFGADFKYYDGLSTRFIKCPYGQVGDILWVRETFAMSYDTEDHPELSYNHQERWNTGYVYKADGEPFYMIDKWKPSIFMPREACRIMLEITNIRVERLQNISEQDAISEGIIHKSMNYPVIEFQHLWQFINGHESWEANPWVWVIEFKRIEK